MEYSYGARRQDGFYQDGPTSLMQSQQLPPLDCQAHATGDMVAIPKGLRSNRRARAPGSPSSPSSRLLPVKRQRTLSKGDEDEQAIAEMLLDLSAVPSPSSSPRKACSQLSDGGTEGSSATQIEPLSPVAQQAKTEKQGRGGTIATSRRNTSGADGEGMSSTPKDAPGRCKCGKRVSAAHPPCKSELMLLCERFQERFGRLSNNGKPTKIHLNECAIALGVPRRRLYDIINVFEAAEVVKRMGKLAYEWCGLAHIPALVEQLLREEAAGLPVGDRKGSTTAASDRQTTHSLWMLSRKFIRLLLTTKGPIQLTEVAEQLIGGQVKEEKRQQTQITVERRLYDVGSILATLKLIQRTYLGKRQPAFSWNWDWQCPSMPSELPASPASPPVRDDSSEPSLDTTCQLPSPKAAQAYKSSGRGPFSSAATVCPPAFQVGQVVRPVPLMAGLPHQDSATLSEAGQQGSCFEGTNVLAPHSAQAASMMPGIPLHLQGMWAMSMAPNISVQVPMPVRPVAMSMGWTGPATGNSAGHLQLQPSFPPLQSNLGVAPYFLPYWNGLLPTVFRTASNLGQGSNMTCSAAASSALPVVDAQEACCFTTTTEGCAL